METTVIKTPGGRRVHLPTDARLYRCLRPGQARVHSGVIEIEKALVSVTFNPEADDAIPADIRDSGKVWVLFNPWIPLSDFRFFLSDRETHDLLDAAMDAANDAQRLTATEAIRGIIEDICESMDGSENLEWLAMNPRHGKFYPYSHDDGTAAEMRPCVPKEPPSCRFLEITNDLGSCCFVLRSDATHGSYEVLDAECITIFGSGSDAGPLKARPGDVVVDTETGLRVLSKEEFARDYKMPPDGGEGEMLSGACAEHDRVGRFVIIDELVSGCATLNQNTNYMFEVKDEHIVQVDDGEEPESRLTVDGKPFSAVVGDVVVDTGDRTVEILSLDEFHRGYRAFN